jgi:hypothetical protein
MSGMCGFAFFALTIATEARTHIKAICKHCGHIWLID